MKRGFSLVELSIVLVILGLITGSILAGQSLIRAAGMRTINADVDRYITAVYSFRDKYLAVPGDMSNATRFWGAQDTDPATCYSTVSTNALTCDGNGDGTLQPTNISGNIYYNEMFRSWQHLANAGLIEGRYSGRTGAAAPINTSVAAIGVNVPSARIGNAGYTFFYLSSYNWINPAADLFEGNYGNYITVGRVSNLTNAPFLKPEEAWNIDTKVDDGKPGRGKLVTYIANNPNCATSHLADMAEYKLTETSENCSFIIRPGL